MACVKIMRHFPSFSEGLSLRRFVGCGCPVVQDFPSFSEGLSLRPKRYEGDDGEIPGFPFLFGGTFIEARKGWAETQQTFEDFPSFSEGLSLRLVDVEPAFTVAGYFPSFSEGLSLRPGQVNVDGHAAKISLPFRRDFH